MTHVGTNKQTEIKSRHGREFLFFGGAKPPTSSPLAHPGGRDALFTSGRSVCAFLSSESRGSEIYLQLVNAVINTRSAHRWRRLWRLATGARSTERFFRGAVGLVRPPRVSGDNPVFVDPLTCRHLAVLARSWSCQRRIYGRSVFNLQKWTLPGSRGVTKRRVSGGKPSQDFLSGCGEDLALCRTRQRIIKLTKAQKSDCRYSPRRFQNLPRNNCARGPRDFSSARSCYCESASLVVWARLQIAAAGSRAHGPGGSTPGPGLRHRAGSPTTTAQKPRERRNKSSPWVSSDKCAVSLSACVPGLADECACVCSLAS